MIWCTWRVYFVLFISYKYCIYQTYRKYMFLYKLISEFKSLILDTKYEPLYKAVYMTCIHFINTILKENWAGCIHHKLLSL